MNLTLLSLALTFCPILLCAAFVGLGKMRNWLDWSLSALLCVGVAFHAYLAGPAWAWIGIGWRWSPFGIVAIVALWSAWRVWMLPVPAGARFLPTTMRGVAAVVVGMIVLDLQIARRDLPTAVDIAMPLEAGHYAVIQGGASRAINHHRAVPAQAHAVDFVELQRHGRRAAGLRPERLEAYEIFGRAVVAPCEGIVSGLLDGAPDQRIGEQSRVAAAGNHVLLSCTIEGHGFTVLLAHLKAGSVAVSVGDAVERGARLGRVGNSGRSSEPHLHVHAVAGRGRRLDVVIAGGEAVPLTFEGRTLPRNSVIAVPGAARRPDP